MTYKNQQKLGNWIIFIFACLLIIGIFYLIGWWILLFPVALEVIRLFEN
jgi:hypothetical protein